MNLKIIQTPDYILGIDIESKIFKGDYFLLGGKHINRYMGNNPERYTTHLSVRIVAHLPLNGNKSLEGVWLLPEIENWEELYQKNGIALQDERNKLLFRKGYKAAGGKVDNPKFFIFSGEIEEGKLKGEYVYE